jgi:hypothetical protein
LEKAVGDYEKVLEIQKFEIAKLEVHPRGGLLFGLAEGWRRLGNEMKAQSYLERIVQTCKDSGYEKEAREWLVKALDPEKPSTRNCSGCHTN